jgi:hypothetical protein
MCFPVRWQLATTLSEAHNLFCTPAEAPVLHTLDHHFEYTGQALTLPWLNSNNVESFPELILNHFLPSFKQVSGVCTE